MRGLRPNFRSLQTAAGLFKLRDLRAEEGVEGTVTSLSPSFCGVKVPPRKPTLWHTSDVVRRHPWLLGSSEHFRSRSVQTEVSSISLRLLRIREILSIPPFGVPPEAAFEQTPSSDLGPSLWFWASSSSMYLSLRSRALFSCATSRSYWWILASRAATVYLPNLNVKHKPQIRSILHIWVTNTV